ncbi:YcbX family protein [Colwellia sp. 1_MG-2023]|uniref:YcbX family protein n=1 Tax=Colwellia sp. 1_MG-2023 TaxID=3062649 RepID=UPI0026E15085|nr:YcbX family protein [Colwellia sp. 1_MG-2023]MDO6445201.1 YcbX family protein [Colwellia sp. 1_MG-2023]
MTSPIVQSLHIYPIKSTAEIALSKSWIDDFGLSFDRRFVVTDLNGQFITARTQPKLCLIQSYLTPKGLVLTAPNMPELEVTFANFSEQYHVVTVWKDDINALYCHQHYDKWFSQYLNLPCQLHFFADKSSRKVNNSDKQVGFADGYPLLLISQASLNDLNNRLTTRYGDNASVSMTQFRPNIVVNDTMAFAEDGWQRIRIGDIEFEVVKPCSRCVFTTIDPNNAEKHPNQEPLSTLKSYRQVAKGDVMFGQNIIPLSKGQIKQGDNVTILSHQAPLHFIPNQKIYSEESKEDNKPENKQENKQVNETAISETIIPKKVNISFDSWNKNHKGNTQEPILDQGEAAGLILPYSCRGGMCGRCKIKLNAGTVKQLADDGLTDDEKAQGYILACSSIPQSDLVVSSN